MPWDCCAACARRVSACCRTGAGAGRTIVWCGGGGGMGLEPRSGHGKSGWRSDSESQHRSSCHCHCAQRPRPSRPHTTYCFDYAQRVLAAPGSVHSRPYLDAWDHRASQLWPAVHAILSLYVGQAVLQLTTNKLANGAPPTLSSSVAGVPR